MGTDIDAERRAAVEAVYREHEGKLWRALHLSFGSAEIASEAVAEAFAQLLGRGTAVHDPAAWVWRAAFKIAAGEMQRTKMLPLPDELPAGSPDSLVDLERALGALTRHQRIAVVLADYAGWSHRDIADAIGSTSAAVAVHIHRARRHLRSPAVPRRSADEVVAVRHEPGQGLPASNVSVIDVPGAAWNAFVFSSYSAIGIVTGLGPNDAILGERLIVPSGCESLRLFAEAFLAARRAGAGAETFLAPGVVDEFGRQGVGPLYAESDGGGGYISSKVLFLGPCDPGSGGSETGVGLEADDGTVSEETLFIRYRDGVPIIDGLRGGTTGP